MDDRFDQSESNINQQANESRHKMKNIPGDQTAAESIQAVTIDIWV